MPTCLQQVYGIFHLYDTPRLRGTEVNSLGFSFPLGASRATRVQSALAGEAPIEQLADRPRAVRVQRSRSRAGEVRVRDDRFAGADWRPELTCPREPLVLFLIEHIQRLIAQLGELRAPA